ncbi:Sodium/hydrogen exchanger 7, partial [Ascosphaera atra]
AVNWVIRYRAKRRGKDGADELPFAYQGMLFWAGLRGAVGVALAAGLEGENAPALRATVLVVVVLTVIIFGGTTARMLEILNIRTGVVEEVDSDDEFDIEPAPRGTYYKHNGRGIGYYPSRRQASGSSSIPLDQVAGGEDAADVGPARAIRAPGSTRSAPVSGGLAARKPGAPPHRLDRALSTGSSSSLVSPEPSAATGELEDLDLEVNFDYDDDDLPPPAVSRLRADPSSQPLLTQDAPPEGLQPPIQATPAEAGPSSTGGMDGRLFSRERLNQARSAVSHLFSGAGEGDHTAWFKQLDEDYIKPRLLLDGAEGRKPPKGPGAEEFTEYM